MSQCESCAGIANIKHCSGCGKKLPIDDKLVQCVACGSRLLHKIAFKNHVRMKAQHEIFTDDKDQPHVSLYLQLKNLQ